MPPPKLEYKDESASKDSFIRVIDSIISNFGLLNSNIESLRASPTANAHFMKECFLYRQIIMIGELFIAIRGLSNVRKQEPQGEDTEGPKVQNQTVLQQQIHEVMSRVTPITVLSTLQEVLLLNGDDVINYFCRLRNEAAHPEDRGFTLLPKVDISRQQDEVDSSMQSINLAKIYVTCMLQLVSKKFFIDIKKIIEKSTLQKIEWKANIHSEGPAQALSASETQKALARRGERTQEEDQLLAYSKLFQQNCQSLLSEKMDNPFLKEAQLGARQIALMLFAAIQSKYDCDPNDERTKTFLLECQPGKSRKVLFHVIADDVISSKKQREIENYVSKFMSLNLSSLTPKPSLSPPTAQSGKEPSPGETLGSVLTQLTEGEMSVPPESPIMSFGEGVGGMPGPPVGPQSKQPPKQPQATSEKASDTTTPRSPTKFNK